MKTSELRDYLDALLRTAEISDYPNAFNGLQLDNRGEVTRVVAAVDACEAVIEQAVAASADLLLVHHGFLWGGAQRIEGALFRKLQRALAAGLAIYSSHLPLDAHPEFGNNAQLAHAIGLTQRQPFLEKSGTPIGWKGELELPREVLRERLAIAVGGPVHLAPGGPELTRCVAVVTGGAGSEVAVVARAGVDTFITGEGPHASYVTAEEVGVNLFYAGHYATETFGVKALAAHLEQRFGLPWSFLDHPTGL